jgi:hypothetical protein
LENYRSIFGAAGVFFNKHKTPAPGNAILFIGECGTYLKRRTPRRVSGLGSLVGHDSRKARTRRLHARLAYVMRVDDRAS